MPAVPPEDREKGPDAVWISHFHGDHFFGLPFLLMRLHEQGRVEDLHVAGPQGIARAVEAVMELAYPGQLPILSFYTRFHEAASGDSLEMGGLRLGFALTDHGRPCLGLRLEDDDTSLFYSGDGGPSPATRSLAKGCRLVIHEGCSLEAGIPGHGSVAEAIAFAGEAEAESLAVVHVKRDVRNDRGDEIQAMLEASGLDLAVMPEAGDVLTL